MVKTKKAAARLSIEDKIFDTLNCVVMFIFFLIMLYPLYYIIIASISDIQEVGLGNVILLPKGINIDAYIQVFNYQMIWTGYANSLLYTSLSIIYNLLIMLPLAYALSKKYLYARNGLTWYFLFTMYFGGGMIPAYLLRVQMLGLNNSIWVLILGSVSVYYMVVTRTFFMTSIPEELYEAAEIDGASQFRCFFTIALPLAVPIIAVMALFFGVGMWNSYFSAMIYIQSRDKYPLQLVLRSILILNERIRPDADLFVSLSPEQMEEEVARQHLALSMKYSTIFISSAPLLIAYPFVQRHFVKGVMIGSLKG